MHLDGPQLGIIGERILKITRPGKVTEWVDRIAELAVSAGATDAELSHVNWSNSPSMVVFGLAQEINRRWNIEKLTDELDRREQAK